MNSIEIVLKFAQCLNEVFPFVYLSDTVFILLNEKVYGICLHKTCKSKVRKWYVKCTCVGVRNHEINRSIFGIFL